LIASFDVGAAVIGSSFPLTEFSTVPMQARSGSRAGACWSARPDRPDLLCDVARFDAVRAGNEKFLFPKSCPVAAILRERLACPVSLRHIGRHGDVAEWLKAAVC
jgi:hypothetical protein